MKSAILVKDFKEMKIIFCEIRKYLIEIILLEEGFLVYINPN